METRKNVFLWASYDFANSLVSIVFFLYFAQWIVVDKGIADIFFNLTFTITALLLLFTVPVTGALLDKSWRRITGLRWTTVLTFVFYSICALFAINDMAIWALVFFTIGAYVYLLSFTFYTPLINDICKHEKRGFVSGLGISANYLGQITGLLSVLLFSNGTWSIFNANPRVETLLPALVLFFIFSLPMLLFFYEPRKTLEKISFKYKIKETLLESKLLFSSASIGLFMISYFLFNDAILTAANNFPIFLEQVWHVSDTIKTFILLGVLVTSAVGGLASGYIADKLGHKKTLMVILAGWVILLPIVGLIEDFTLFVVSTTLMGFWFGASWTVSRSVMAYLCPKGKHNLAFGYFGLAERASSFIGPIVWGLIVSGLVHMGSERYRIAIMAITGFIVLGLIFLSRVRDDRKEVNHINN